MLRRAAGRRAALAVLALLGGVAVTAGRAEALGGAVCVDLGVGAVARTVCSIPDGSQLARESREVTCELGLLNQTGVVRWEETDPIIVPPLSLPGFDWFEVQQLNQFYLTHRDDYGGQVRFFWKRCKSPSGDIATIADRPLVVPITDPLVDIRADVAAVALALPLPRPELSTLPEPGVYYGLKVNNPAWVAVTPASWRTVVTPPRWLRGWEVTLIVRPVTMAFTIQQGGRTVTVACDPGAQRYVRGSERFPTEPAGFTDESNWFDPPEDPLPARPCSWTPRAKGAGTVTVAITYDVRASAAGFLFQFAPRTNTAVTPIEVTELRTVNLRP